MGRSANLTVTISRETTGRYNCRAHVPSFPDVTSDAYVRMNGRPTIQKDGVQYGLVGEIVRLDCSAHSVPSPVKTSWSFNGQLIGPDHRDYTVSICTSFADTCPLILCKIVWCFIRYPRINDHFHFIGTRRSFTGWRQKYITHT